MVRDSPIPIAIVGIGCRFPGEANSPEAFWNLLAEGRTAWTEVPADRFQWKSFFHPSAETSECMNQHGGHFVQGDIAAFDAEFFELSPLETKAIDPQQRLLLETTYEALESAGIRLECFSGSNAAVFAASFASDYERMLSKDLSDPTRFHLVGTGSATFANRISHAFDLSGPSVTIDTGCSGGLVAVHQACQSLRSFECDLTIAGGAVLTLSPDQMVIMSNLHLLNSEGRCFSFDSRGSGYGRGEGAAVLLLKRLDDALREDLPIRAIIRSSAVNQDGKTSGITLPSQNAQDQLSHALFRDLNISPIDVHYVEAHGTGTVAGDRAEYNCIREFYCKNREDEQPLLVGCAKPNIGHLEPASGLAGIIKAILSMEHGLITPNVLFDTPKRDIAWDPQTIKIPTSLEPWSPLIGPRRAVVNNFGYGGTNAMVLLEEHRHAGPELASHTREIAETSDSRHSQPSATSPVNISSFVRWHLIQFSAKSEFSLSRYLEDVAVWLSGIKATSLGAIASSLAQRSALPCRYAIVADSVLSLNRALQASRKLRKSIAPKLIFAFTGQGAQWPQMGRCLMVHSTYCQSMQTSDRILRDLGAPWSLLQELELCESESRIYSSDIAQPATTALQIALVDLLRSWNINANGVIGHSSGEIAAAFTAGALSHEDALSVAYHRGFWSRKAELKIGVPGGMMAVGLSEAEVRQHMKVLDLEDYLTVACINSPASITVSGKLDALMNFKAALDAKDVFTRRLKTDTAYHSRYMRHVSDIYLFEIRNLPLRKPKIDFFSTVTGNIVDMTFSPRYWIDNLLLPVQFAPALENMYSNIECSDHLTFIEIGPHSALRGPIRDTLSALPTTASWEYISALTRGADDEQAVLQTAALLFESGINVTLYQSREPSNLVTKIPTYHWDHSQKYWHEPRLSRNYRFRKYPPDALLGLRNPTSPEDEPSWRVILDRDKLFWLNDHIIDGFAIFPATAYLAMAAQAMEQWYGKDFEDNTVLKSEFKKVTFSRTLQTTSDNALELVTTLRRNKSSWTEFRIYSVLNDEWNLHCEGHMRTSSKKTAHREQIPHNSQVPVENPETGDHDCWQNHLNAFSRSCVECIDGGMLYDVLRSAGNTYGPSLKLIQEAFVSNTKALAKVVVPRVDPTLPDTGGLTSSLHPALPDTCLQLAVFLFARIRRVSGVVPSFIRGIRVKLPPYEQIVEKELAIICEVRDVSDKGAKFDVSAFECSSDLQCAPVLQFFNGELRATGNTTRQTLEYDKHIAFEMRWEVDPACITGEDMEALPSHASLGLETQQHKLGCLLSAARYFIASAMQHLPLSKEFFKGHPHSRLLEVLASHTRLEADDTISNQQEDIMQDLSHLGAEGEILSRIGPSLRNILEGSIDPLSLLLEDQLLYRVYQDDSTTRCNTYLIKYLQHLTFKNPNMRILEIGAGTGGTSLPLFQELSPSGQPFAASYHFTDISSGFFEQANIKISKWGSFITMKTLDIEKDPVSQGFEKHSYDVVIASNALHATKSIEKTLYHVHKLLRPGGILALIELVKSNSMYDMTFGLLPGWWAGVEDGRIHSPLLEPEQWGQQLLRASFSGIEVMARDFPGSALRAAFIVSQAMGPSSDKQCFQLVQVVSLFGRNHPGQKLATSLIDQLNEKGFQASDRTWDDALANPAKSPACSVILDFHDAPFLATCTSAQFLQLNQLIAQLPRLVWITLPRLTSPLKDPGGALIVGYARTARAEYESLDFITVNIEDDVSSSCSHIGALLVGLIDSYAKKRTQARFFDFEYSIQSGRIVIPRIVNDHSLSNGCSPTPSENEVGHVFFHSSERPMQMQVQNPGLLNTIGFNDADPDKDLATNEVDIEVQAIGVNFKDVWIALGQMRSNDELVGECAGNITAVGKSLQSEYKVGDRVCALTATPYTSKARATGHVIQRIPKHMTFIEAASIPVAFCTAYYALVEAARLQQDERVLIHSGSGALGQAAIQIARHLGAEVFTTVSTPEKKALLVNRYNILDNHIFSSRSTAFKYDVLRMTSGTGVDVALNSLAGDMLEATWESIAGCGTMVELGKFDIHRNAKLDMEQFDKNIAYSGVDLILLTQRRPKLVQRILKSIFRMFEENVLHLVSPITRLPIADAETAFRLMQARKHTGKLVLEANNDAQVMAPKQPFRLRPDRTYIIAGGLGRLGQQLCKHLCMLKAGTIILLSRRDFTAKKRQEMEERLDLGRKIVKILTCDISEPDQVASIAHIIEKEFPPIKGIIQSSMVLNDRSIKEMSHDEFHRTIWPKYNGTRNLVEAFENKDLDFFVLMSSLSGIVGLPGQANYAAGNVYQDEVAQLKPSTRWKTCITLNLAAIVETHPFSKEKRMQLHRRGIASISNHDLFPHLDYAMDPGISHNGVKQILIGLDFRAVSTHNQTFYSKNPIFTHVFATTRGPEYVAPLVNAETTALKRLELGIENYREEFIQAVLCEKIASLVAMELQDVKVSRSISSFGIDSLIAIELKNWISRVFKISLQISDILDSSSITSVAAVVQQRRQLPTLHKTQSKPNLRYLMNPVTNAMLPKIPLRPLSEILESFSKSIIAVATEEELTTVRQLIEKFQRPKGLGHVLYARLEQLALEKDDWLSNLFTKTFWLQRREPLRPWINFFSSHAETKSTYSQAGKAAILTLACFEFKQKLDRNEIPWVFNNDHPQCMESLAWIFNTCRRPGIISDETLKFPGNDYIVAMRHGHVYKVPLLVAGQTITRKRLSAVFNAIRATTPPAVCWASILTTDERSSWAANRQIARDLSPLNRDLFMTIEQSLFVVCLEDGEPQTSEQRVRSFLLDDNSNRWNDKTLTLIVCENGASALWCEHSMIDGSTLDQLQHAILQAVVASDVPHIPNSSKILEGLDFTYVPFQSFPGIERHINTVQEQYRSSIRGADLATLELPFGENYLRKHKLSPKGAMQAMVSLAIRSYFGYSPACNEGVSLRSFHYGRTDIYQFYTPEMAAFVSAALISTYTSLGNLKGLLREAVAAHTEGVTGVSRGRGWDRQLSALRAVIRDDEPEPELFRDPVYLRTRPRKVFVTFSNMGMQEWGNVWRDKESLWIGIEVFDYQCKFCVISWDERAKRFCGLVEKMAAIFKEIIES